MSELPLRVPGKRLGERITRLKLGRTDPIVQPAIAAAGPIRNHQTMQERQAARAQAQKIQRNRDRSEPPPAPEPKPGVKPRTDAQYQGSVPRLFEGRVAVMFATGPSLTKEVVEAVRPYHEAGKVVAFGCNDAYRIVPYLDVIYACDPPWWDVHAQSYDVLDYDATLWTQDRGAAAKWGLNWIGGTSNQGLSLVQDKIHYGGNSGFQILNLAFLYGCDRFILCGYNMGIPQGMGQHFFGQHPKPLSRGTSFGSFVSSYNGIQKNIQAKIINATPHSALQCFRRMTVEEALEHWTSLDDTPAVQQS